MYPQSVFIGTTCPMFTGYLKMLFQLAGTCIVSEASKAATIIVDEPIGLLETRSAAHPEASMLLMCTEWDLKERQTLQIAKIARLVTISEMMRDHPPQRDRHIISLFPAE